MSSCIYSIINLKTKNKYIGSAVDIDKRIYQHIRLLSKNEHHSIHLQRSWNKHGKDAFIFHVIEYCDKDKLREIEQLYLIGLKPKYNMSLSTYAPMEGRKHSQETLDKYKGRKVWNKGIKRTEEEKINISTGYKKIIKEKGKDYLEYLSKRTKAYIEKFGTPFKGKHHTEENKAIFRNKNKSKKKIICINTGEVFEAQIDITRKYGLRQGHISEHLQGKRPHVKGYKFKYE